MAAVGAAIGAVGGHLRRDLGRAVVVVAVAVPEFFLCFVFSFGRVYMATITRKTKDKHSKKINRG
jgi:hypothetical protein